MRKAKIQLIDVAPSDIKFLFELNSGGVRSMGILLDNMQFNYNSSISQHVEAKKFLEEQLYPLIQQSIKTLEGAGNDT